VAVTPVWNKSNREHTFDAPTPKLENEMASYYAIGFVKICDIDD